MIELHELPLHTLPRFRHTPKDSRNVLQNRLVQKGIGNRSTTALRERHTPSSHRVGSECDVAVNSKLSAGKRKLGYVKRKRNDNPSVGPTVVPSSYCLTCTSAPRSERKDPTLPKNHQLEVETESGSVRSRTLPHFRTRTVSRRVPIRSKCRNSLGYRRLLRSGIGGGRTFCRSRGGDRGFSIVGCHVGWRCGSGGRWRRCL